jgi:voltage-gated potassium channel Kch
MEKAIAKLKGHCIVCGFGRLGRNVAQELEIMGRRFVVIDRDENQLISQLERHPKGVPNCKKPWQARYSAVLGRFPGRYFL